MSFVVNALFEIMFGWVIRKVWIFSKRIFKRNRPISVFETIRSARSVLLILPYDNNSFPSALPAVKLLKKLKKNKKMISLVGRDKFYLLKRTRIEKIFYEGKLTPLTSQYTALKDALKKENCDILVDFNRKRDDRSTIISTLSKAKLRIATFENTPFFNCQAKQEITRDEQQQNLALIKILTTK